MSAKKITVKEVAQHAGVSISTVSMVLNDKGRISHETIERVNRSIVKLGYVQNPVATALRSKQIKAIGLILQDMTHPYYMEVAAGLSDALEQAGYMLFISQTKNQLSQFEDYVRALVQQQVSGVVFQPIDNELEQTVATINASELTSLCIARSSLPVDMDLACPDNIYGAAKATEALIAQGHRQIAYIGGRSHSPTRAERLAGYCSTLMKYNLPFQPQWVLETDGSQASATLAVQNLLSHQPKITGLICHDSQTALGVAEGLQNVGRAIGQDIYIGQQVTLTVLDGGNGVHTVNSPLPSSTIFQLPARTIGEQVGERILQRIKNRDLPCQRLMLKPEMIVLHR